MRKHTTDDKHDEKHEKDDANDDIGSNDTSEVVWVRSAGDGEGRSSAAADCGGHIFARVSSAVAEAVSAIEAPSASASAKVANGASEMFVTLGRSVTGGTEAGRTTNRQCVGAGRRAVASATCARERVTGFHI